MNRGRWVISAMFAFAAVFGAVLWYVQTRAYYEPVAAEDVTIVATRFDGTTEPLPIRDFQGIDADTSPLRFRACFSTPLTLAMMTETYQPYEDATPLIAPDWFDCFDAGALTGALEDGTALAFLGEGNFIYGFDSVVMLTESGRGYAWHQINSCGEAAYNGRPVPAGCPPAPELN